MRVTDNMVSNNILSNIQNTLSKISKLHDQLSSGYRVRFPSDDAVVATRASNIDSSLRELEQYKRNMDHAESLINAYDSSLKEISSVYNRIRELLVKGANSTLSDDDRSAIAEELSKLKEHIRGIVNTKLGNDYLFGGYMTDTQPVDENYNIVITPEASKRRFVNVLSYKIEFGITARDVLITENQKSVFDVLDNAYQALMKGDGQYISEISLKDLDYLERSVMDGFARVGATQKMAELVKSRIEDLNIFLTEHLSKERDADLSQTITELSMQQAVLDAALKSAASVLRKTLVDFV
ncbi:MAG: flagellar hook-associated protein FlgL [Thermotogaceae bacterium]|nr:flagellar hook-associated protein FlgL [Thermotogaceae bacterium]